jgi:hypothetical protein
MLKKILERVLLAQRFGDVEFHLYQNGGHGFGLGNPNRTSNRWFDAFMHWLDVNKFLMAK